MDHKSITQLFTYYYKLIIIKLRRKKIKRLIEVTWFLPNIGNQKEIYDMDNPSDTTTWKLNEELYACQIRPLPKKEIILWHMN